MPAQPAAEGYRLIPPDADHGMIRAGDAVALVIPKLWPVFEAPTLIHLQVGCLPIVARQPGAAGIVPPRAIRRVAIVVHEQLELRVSNRITCNIEGPNRERLLVD